VLLASQSAQVACVAVVGVQCNCNGVCLGRLQFPSLLFCARCGGFNKLVGCSWVHEVPSLSYALLPHPLDCP
jgi:hypothetical protein